MGHITSREEGAIKEITYKITPHYLSGGPAKNAAVGVLYTALKELRAQGFKRKVKCPVSEDKYAKHKVGTLNYLEDYFGVNSNTILHHYKRLKELY